MKAPKSVIRATLPVTTLPTANLVSAWLGNQTFTNKNNIFGYTFEAPQPTKLAKNNKYVEILEVAKAVSDIKDIMDAKILVSGGRGRALEAPHGVPEGLGRGEDEGEEAAGEDDSGLHVHALSSRV